MTRASAQPDRAPPRAARRAPGRAGPFAWWTEGVKTTARSFPHFLQRVGCGGRARTRKGVACGSLLWIAVWSRCQWREPLPCFEGGGQLCAWYSSQDYYHALDPAGRFAPRGAPPRVSLVVRVHGDVQLRVRQRLRRWRFRRRVWGLPPGHRLHGLRPTPLLAPGGSTSNSASAAATTTRGPGSAVTTGAASCASRTAARAASATLPAFATTTATAGAALLGRNGHGASARPFGFHVHAIKLCDAADAGDRTGARRPGRPHQRAHRRRQLRDHGDHQQEAHPSPRGGPPGHRRPPGQWLDEHRCRIRSSDGGAQ